MRHSKPNQIAPGPVGAVSHRTAPHRRSWKQRLPYTGSESVYLFLGFTILSVLHFMYKKKGTKEKYELSLQRWLSLLRKIKN